MQSDLDTARQLRDAAGYLREYGWRQGGVGDHGGPRCLLGALLDGYDLMLALEPVGSARLDHLAVMLGLAESVDTFRGLPTLWDGVWRWNDAHGRTADEVIDRLESTALALELRHFAANQPAEVEPAVELVTA